jgi:hypothetical protein
LYQAEKEEEPYEIKLTWSKLTNILYNELRGDSDAADNIVDSIEDETDLNWELKVLNALFLVDLSSKKLAKPYFTSFYRKLKANSIERD